MQIATFDTISSTEELEEDSDSLDEVYSEWNDHVNMTASELRRWSKNPCSREASVDAVAVIKRNLRLLEKNKDEWTQNDIDDAKRTTSFISRMRGNEGETTADGGSNGCPDDKSISLLNWAYNPFDSLPDGPDEDADLDAVEEVTLSSNITAYNVVEELGYDEGEFVEIKEDAFEEAGLDEVEIDDEHDGEYDYRRYGYVVEKNKEDFNWKHPEKDEGQTIEVDEGETVYVVATGATGTGAHLFYEGALRTANEDDVVGDIGEEKDPSEANLSEFSLNVTESIPNHSVDTDELQVVGSAPVLGTANIDGAPWPKSWRKSEKPARLIGLDAYTSFDPPSFRGCRREMKGKVANVNAYCANFKDVILGTTYWRDGGD